VLLLKDIFLKGAGMAAEWRPLLMLALFTVLISCSAMRSFHKNLE